MENGEDIHLKYINGKEQEIAIRRIKQVDTEELAKMMANETKEFQQKSSAFHSKFLPVLIMSNLNQKEIVRNIEFERQAIEDMDTDLQEVVKNIFNSKNIRTTVFEQNCS